MIFLAIPPSIYLWSTVKLKLAIGAITTCPFYAIGLSSIMPINSTTLQFIMGAIGTNTSLTLYIPKLVTIPGPNMCFLMFIGFKSIWKLKARLQAILLIIRSMKGGIILIKLFLLLCSLSPLFFLIEVEVSLINS